MQSKNKPKPTQIEREWIALIAEQPCVVCGAPGPSHVHEFEQGVWFSSCALCPECHTGGHGWHGDRLRWNLRKMTQAKAIAKTVQRCFEKFGAWK